MRILLFFDLPMVSPSDVKNYTKFRRGLIREGFIMVQHSVYSKLALNHSSVALIKKRISKLYPPKGDIQILVITEKQYNSIEYIYGAKKTSTLDSTDRLVVI